MPPSNNNRSQHSQQFNALIVEYELAAEQGRPLDPEAFVQQHPDFAAELRQYFAGAGLFQGWIGPLQATPMSTITVGLKIRDYQVVEKIGAGGMGTVYQARHTRLKKTVALKIMKADRERDSQAIRRFELEMEAVGKLEHPHIVRALDAGDEAGMHFLVMEFLDGCDLGRLLKVKGRLELPLACELIRQAALGLQHAHDHNLVHRDVKPSNLMLSVSGQVKVLDLGLAQLQASIEEPGDQTRIEHAASGAVKSLTREGQFVGTWRYMAPEQFLTSRQVDSRADIFSLGVTFYCFLVGELPLGPGQTAAYLPPIATLRPDVPPDVQLLLAQMLALNQEERIQTMSEVANVLQTYAMQGSVNIQAIGASLELAKQGISHALDGTQSWSSTADEPEVIPPPVQEPPLPEALPAVQVPLPIRRPRWQLLLGGVAAAVLLAFVIGTNWPGPSNTITGVVFPPPPPPPVVGTVDLKPFPLQPDQVDALPKMWAVPKGEVEKPILIQPGRNELPPGDYWVYADDLNWELTPAETVVAIGSVKDIEARQWPTIGWQYPRFPEKSGAFLVGSGAFWINVDGMPERGLLYELTLRMGEPEEFDDEVGRKIPCRWLELKVDQGDYTETARLLVDTQEYERSKGSRLIVRKGWLTATSPDIQKWLRYLNHPHENPPQRLVVKFDKTTDSLRNLASQTEPKIKLPSVRFSVQDALVMLFGAECYSGTEALSGESFRRTADQVQTGARKLFPVGRRGKHFGWSVESNDVDDAGNRVLRYAHFRHEQVPFNVLKIVAKVPDRLNATFTHTGDGMEPAEFAANLEEEALACNALLSDIVKFDEASLPVALGAEAQYLLKINRDGVEQTFDVRLRMADAQRPKSRLRWLEVDVTSKSTDFGEQALLEVEDLRDQLEDFSIKRGYLIRQDEVFPFNGDREPLDLDLLKLGKKPQSSPLTVHDVLTLMFDVHLESTPKIRVLRAEVAALRQQARDKVDQNSTFTDIELHNRRRIPGEEWKLRYGGTEVGYTFTRSRELPFDFNGIHFLLIKPNPTLLKVEMFELNCGLTVFTAEGKMASLLNNPLQKLQALAKLPEQAPPSTPDETFQALQTLEKRTTDRAQPPEIGNKNNWREWNIAAGPYAGREWGEFRGELKDGTVFLGCKRAGEKDAVISFAKHYLSEEDKRWIEQGRYWSVSSRPESVRAKFWDKTNDFVRLRLPDGKPPITISFGEFSRADQDWITFLGGNLGKEAKKLAEERQKLDAEKRKTMPPRNMNRR